MNDVNLNPLGTTARIVLLAITVIALIVYFAVGEDPLAIPGVIVVGLAFAWLRTRLDAWATRGKR